MQRSTVIALSAALGLTVPAVAQQNYYPILNPTGQVLCGASATKITDPRTRSAITVIVPTGASNPVYFGPNSSVTTSTGFPVDPGHGMTLQPYMGALYCINGSGSQTVGVAEVY